jgi:hypothetical protein
MAAAWRVLYAVLESNVAIRAAAGVLAVARAVGGARAEDYLTAWFDRRFVRSGWPHHVHGWTNLHMARLLMRVRRRREAAVAAARTIVTPSAAGRNAARLRIGLVGAFRGLLCFPAELFRCAPPDVDVVVFDIPYGGQSAEYLAPLVSRYVPIFRDEVAYDTAMQQAVESIAASRVDLLIHVSDKRVAYDLTDALEHPCIAHYANGSEPLYHPKVALQYFPQPEADYFVVDHRLFCATTRTTFSPARFVRIAPYYDLRGLNPCGAAPWRDREPLITFHGSLYKLASPSYLDELLQLLRDDPAVQLEFMGKDASGALAVIEERARRCGVSAQVHYGGRYQSERDEHGVVADPGWARMIELLRRSRLQANPWPLGGGAARIEAYALGVPCVALKVSFDERRWNTRQPVVCDVPAIHAPSGTATDAADYLDRCRRCLYDEASFERIVAEQRAALSVLTDGQRWWHEVVAGHRDWMMNERTA